MKPDCQRALLNLDRELDPGEAAWQSAHLAACDACLNEAALRDRLRARLRHAARPAPVEAALETRVRNAMHTRGVRPQWQAWAAAAAVLMAVGSYWAVPVISNRLAESAYYSELPESVSRIMRVGLSDHVHCAAFRKFRKPPAAEEFPAPFRPVLTHIPAGYRVIAAHECKARGRSFLHVVLRGAAEKTASLVIARKESGETFANSPLRRAAGELPVFTEEVPRFQIAGFEAGAYLVYLVSDMSGEANQQLARTLAAPVSALLLTLS
jgi:anti-sigma factor RsiW